jgi:cAMP phosphodiesterase
VDAGAHLASIVRILEQDMPRSSDKVQTAGETTVLKHNPFAGIEFPFISAKANALYIFRELLHSVLITHPHLDHVSGIAINTPALEYGREAKAIVALPSTIDAIKQNIFNDTIWPNLSDEGHGVGFVTYRRLIEGGNPRLGAGEARGYVNVCDGLATKCWSVSHGKCHRRPHTPSHQRGDSFGWGHADYSFPSRRMSRMSDHDHGYFSAMAQQQAVNAGAYTPMGGSQAAPPTPSMHPSQPSSAIDGNHMFEPVSSSAFFIRNDVTGNELLIFGDIEPDTVSMAPRNHIVWEDAAAKFVAGHLKAIFIECSYDDSVRDADLYGHLCPRHLIAELRWLAGAVISMRKQNGHTLNDSADTTASITVRTTPTSETLQLPSPADAKRKRKRPTNGDLATTPEMAPVEFATPPSPRPLQSGYVGSRAGSSSHSSRRKTSHASNPETKPNPDRSAEHRQRGRSVQFSGSGPSMNVPAGAAAAGQQLSSISTGAGAMLPPRKLDEALKGLTVHVIHVKDTMMDGPSPQVIILEELKKGALDAGLGVEFSVTAFGQSVWV